MQVTAPISPHLPPTLSGQLTSDNNVLLLCFMPLYFPKPLHLHPLGSYTRSTHFVRCKILGKSLSFWGTSVHIIVE